MTYIKEMCRVCKPGGKIVVTLKHDHRYFWQNPENSRPYPPSVFYAMSSTQPSEKSPRSNPMWEALPQFEMIAREVHLRHRLAELAVLYVKSFEPQGKIAGGGVGVAAHERGDVEPVLQAGDQLGSVFCSRAPQDVAQAA